MTKTTRAFKMNTSMNHVNKHKSVDCPNGLVGKLLEELRKWAQPSDLTAVRAENRIQQGKNEKKDDPKVVCSALSAIRSKYEDAGVLVDETKMVTALIAAAPKDYSSSVNTQKGQLEQEMLLLLLKRQ